MVFYLFIWRVIYHDSTMDLLYFFSFWGLCSGSEKTNLGLGLSEGNRYLMVVAVQGPCRGLCRFSSELVNAGLCTAQQTGPHGRSHKFGSPLSKYLRDSEPELVMMDHGPWTMAVADSLRLVSCLLVDNGAMNLNRGTNPSEQCDNLSWLSLGLFPVSNLELECTKKEKQGSQGFGQCASMCLARSGGAPKEMMGIRMNDDAHRPDANALEVSEKTEWLLLKIGSCHGLRHDRGMARSPRQQAGRMGVNALKTQLPTTQERITSSPTAIAVLFTPPSLGRPFPIINSFLSPPRRSIHTVSLNFISFPYP